MDEKSNIMNPSSVSLDFFIGGNMKVTIDVRIILIVIVFLFVTGCHPIYKDDNIEHSYFNNLLTFNDMEVLNLCIGGISEFVGISNNFEFYNQDLVTSICQHQIERFKSYNGKSLMQKT